MSTPEDGAHPAGTAPDDLDDTDEVTRIRRRGEVTGAASESWSGSTMIARRESRRRSSRSADLSSDAGAASDPLDGLPIVPGRAAVDPAALAADDPQADAATYTARMAEAVIVPRRPVAPRDSAPLGEVPVPSAGAARRLAARRLLVVVGGGAAMVIVGTVLLILLLSVR